MVHIVNEERERMVDKLTSVLLCVSVANDFPRPMFCRTVGLRPMTNKQRIVPKGRGVGAAVRRGGGGAGRELSIWKTNKHYKDQWRP